MSSDHLLPVSLTTLIPVESVRTLWWTTVMLVTLVPVTFLFLRIKRRSDMLWKVPGSRGNPFLVAYAVVSAILTNKYINSNVMSFQTLCGVTKMFNKERIYRFWFGFRPIIVFYKPETVEAVLSSNTILDKTFVYHFLNEWFKAGLITSTGAKWKKRRKLLTPAFHFRILEDFLPVINEQASVLVSKLKEESATGQVFDMVPYITLCSLDILCETAMGKYVGAQVKPNNPYLDALGEASAMFMYRIMRPWIWPDWIFYLSPGGRRFKECMQHMGDFTRNVIRERKVEMIRRIKSGEDSDEESNVVKNRKAFLDILIRNHLNDESFTEEDIREEVDTFMFAGHDTTAVGMSWTLYLLGCYPEIQKKIMEEIHSIFGEDKDRQITMEDLKDMKYLECVLKESQRIYPSLPLIGRELAEDAVINGYAVPAGTALMIFTFMLHRNEEVFPKAEVFDPDRFLPENCVGRHPYAYTPFAAGPRNCIGQKFAMQEQKVVLAKIMRNFSLHSVEPRDKILMVSEMVLRSENGIKMILTPRS